MLNNKKSLQKLLIDAFAPVYQEYSKPFTRVGRETKRSFSAK